MRPAVIVDTISTMAFIRKIRKNNRTYFAEVENRWVDGKCVQKHIRYIGKEVDGKTVLSASLSDAAVDSVKVFGPLLVLDCLARKAGLHDLLGGHAREILSMVYAHCLDYRSVTKMQQWFERTDLAMILPLEGVTEQRLLDAMDSLEALDAAGVQRRIFERTVSAFKIPVSGILYDVTNTYLYGKKCVMGRMGHDKGGVKGRPLVQVGLAVTKESGIPICHRALNGNVHDSRMFRDFVTELRSLKIAKGVVIYDRGIASGENLKDAKSLGWNTLCGLPMRGALAETVRALIGESRFVRVGNRVRLRRSVFYAVDAPHEIEGVRGRLVVCFNEQQRRDLRESRYDEVEEARKLLAAGKAVKPGMEKYFSAKGGLLESVLAEAEEFDGYTCLFSTERLTRAETVRLYFDKDLVEKAFRSLKGITRLQPVRHWLYNRVVGHVFICYLAYLLLSLLEFHLKSEEMSAEEALLELDSMYKVYLRDARKGFEVSRVVAMTKAQERILKAIDRKLLKTG